jgi:hypothetical protein
LTLVLEMMTSLRVRRVQALLDVALEHQQTGCLVVLARREHFLDLGAAHDRFDALRTPDAGHFLGDVVGQVIDHVEILHPHLVALAYRAPWRWDGR